MIKITHSGKLNENIPFTYATGPKNSKSVLLEPNNFIVINDGVVTAILGAQKKKGFVKIEHGFIGEGLEVGKNYQESDLDRISEAVKAYVKD